MSVAAAAAAAAVASTDGSSAVTTPAAARALLQRSSGGCWVAAVRADAGCCHRPSSDPSYVRASALQGNLRETQGYRTRQPPGRATMPARSGRVRSSGIGLCRQLTLSGAVAAAAGPELLALPAPEGGTTFPSTSRWESGKRWTATSGQ